jgi:hypothetical protein
MKKWCLNLALDGSLQLFIVTLIMFCSKYCVLCLQVFSFMKKEKHVGAWFLCFKLWAYKLIIFVSCSSWWIKELWFQLFWIILWWHGTLNIRNMIVHKRNISFVFIWQKLSTSINIVVGTQEKLFVCWMHLEKNDLCAYFSFQVSVVLESWGLI